MNIFERDPLTVFLTNDWTFSYKKENNKIVDFGVTIIHGHQYPVLDYKSRGWKDIQSFNNNFLISLIFESNPSKLMKTWAPI